jgi:vitellogenic carboxypeptidase-like protein
VAYATNPGEVSDPVFVTSYLPNRFEDAQNATRVHLPGGWNKNALHSGFFTIDETTSSNTFFVFSEALNGKHDAPILLWLQGGPGASSLFGMFTEIGPFNIGSDMSVVPREVTWNQEYHLLFLDNPLGTGFSFTNSQDKFVTNQTTVGQDLYQALLQFFELFPDLRANEFYVTGESYAGKYVPACAYTIHMQNKIASTEKRINLAGVSIGDGAMDPPSQFDNFGDLLYYVGMADSHEKAAFDQYCAQIQEKLRAADTVGAFRIFDMMLNGDEFPYPTYYANVTGMGSNYFNFEQGPGGSSLKKNFFIDWLSTTAARNAMHTGQIPYHVLNNTVEKYLLGDWMVGVVDFLVPLLENYKVLIYSGQLDIILGAPLTEQFLNGPHLQSWSQQSEFISSKKRVWTIGSGADQDIAGYSKAVGNVTYVVVRGAGHMVPGDQPHRAIDMISRFVNGASF